MKLHLPTGLRRALLTCIASVVSLTPTLGSAVLAGGTFAAVLASQSMAVYVPGEDINVSGPGNLIEEDIALDAPLSVTVTKDADELGDLTISGKITASGDSAGLNVAGNGKLTLSGADSTLGAVTNLGDLMIGASMTASVYDTTHMSGLSIADGAVFTIESLVGSRDMDALLIWNAEAGNTGLVTIKQGLNAVGDSYVSNGVYYVEGRYQVEGDIRVDAWRPATEEELEEGKEGLQEVFQSVYVMDDGYLRVTGDMDMVTGFVCVYKGGELVVDGLVKLGCKIDISYNSFSVSGEGAKASVGGVQLGLSGGDDRVYLSEGTLSVGAGGFQSTEGGEASVYLNGGTLLTGKGFRSDAGVDVTLGSVTMGAASAGAAVFDGDITFTGTVLNQNTLGLVLRDNTLNVEEQSLVRLVSELVSEGEGDSSSNYFSTYKYWLVNNEGDARLTLADGAVAVVGQHEYTMNADGSFSAGNVYNLNVGAVSYSELDTMGASIVRMGEGTSLTIDVEKSAKGISLMGSASIIADVDTETGDVTIETPDDNAEPVVVKAEMLSSIQTADTAAEAVTLTVSSTNDEKIILRGNLNLREEDSLVVDAAHLQVAGNYSLKAVTVTNDGTLTLSGSAQTETGDYIPNVVLNQGSLDITNHSLGSKGLEENGSIRLGGSDEENAAALAAGTLTENTIYGYSTGVYSSIDGVGNLTYVSDGELNLHNTIQNTGDVTLSGKKLGIGVGYGNTAADIRNDGDVIINADVVNMGVQSTLANTGDIRVEAGTFTIDGGSHIANTGALLIQGGTVVLKSNEHFVKDVDGVETVTHDKQVVVSDSGTLRFSMSKDAVALDTLVLSNGTLDMGNWSYGSQEKRGVVQLESPDAETGVLSENVITGSNSAFLSTILGVGNVTFESKGTLNLHSTIEHTGTLTLAGKTLNLGNEWNPASTIVHDGDLIISADQVALNAGTVIANTGDVYLKRGTLNLKQSELANGKDIIVSSNTILDVASEAVIGNAGALRIEGGLVALNSNSHFVTEVDGEKVVTHDKEIIVSDAGTLRLYNKDMTMNKLTLSGGTLEMHDYALGSAEDKGSITLVAAEEANVISGSSTGIYADVTGAGTLALEGGTLHLHNSVTHEGDVIVRSGTIALEADALLANKGALRLEGGALELHSSIRNDGDVILDGNSISFNDGSQLANAGDVHVKRGTLNLKQNELANGKDIIVSSNTILDVASEAVIGNAGALRIEGGLVALNSDSHFVTEVDGEKVVTHDKEIIVSDAGTLRLYNDDMTMNKLTLSGGTLEMHDYALGSAEDKGSITLVAAEEANVISGSSTGIYADVTGAGTLALEGGTLHLRNSISHEGDVVVRSGSHRLEEGASLANTGDLHVANGRLTVDKTTVTNGGNVLVSTGGELELVNGAALANGADVQIQGGALTLRSDAWLSNVSMQGGKLTVEGMVFDRNSAEHSRGVVTLVSSETDAEGQPVLSENVIGGHNSAFFATIEGVGNLTLETTSGADLANTIYSTVQHKGNLSINDTVFIGSWWGGSAHIMNEGDIVVNGGTSWLHYGAFENTGDVRVTGGSLKVDPAYIDHGGNSVRNEYVRIANQGNVEVSGTGQLTISEHAVLDLSAADEGKGIVSVSGGSLVVEEGASFTAKGLELSGGTVTAAETLNVGTLSQTGGKLLLSDGITISGSEAVTLTNGTFATATDLRVGQAATLGNISIGGEEGYEGGVTFFSGDVTLSGKVTQAGPGTLALTGNILGHGGIEVTKGSLSIGIWWQDIHVLETGDISLAKGTTLYFNDGVGDFKAKAEDGSIRQANLSMMDASLVVDALSASDSTAHWGELKLATSGEEGAYSSISRSSWDGTVAFDVLTGEGDLNVALYGSKRNAVAFGTIRDYNGTITVSNQSGSLCALYINSVEQGEGYEASINGVSRSNGAFTKTGEGKLTLAAHTAEGSFTVAEGTLATTGTLTAGSLALTGGKLLLGANLTSSNGIELAGGTLAASADVTISGATTISGVTLGGEEGYEGSLTFTGATTFANAITNQANLVLNGALVLAEEADISTWEKNADKGTFVSEVGGLAGNWYYLVQGADGSQLSLGKDNISGYTLAQDGNSASFFVANEGSAYYVLAGQTADYSKAHELSDTINLAHEATLNVGNNIIVDGLVEVAENAASTIEMGSSSSLSSSKVAIAEGGSLAVTGSGGYVVAEATGLDSTTIGGDMNVNYNFVGSITAQGQSYGGGTVITNGTVVAGDSQAFGSGYVFIAGGALQANGVSLANAVNAGALSISELGEAPVAYTNVQVDAKGISSTGEGAALSGAQVSIVAGGASSISLVSLAESDLSVAGTLTTEGDLSVQNLVLNGGKLLLGGSLSGSGAANFNGGTVAAASDITVAQDVTLDGTSFGGESGYSGGITFTGAASIASTLTNNGTLAFAGALELAEGAELVAGGQNTYSEGTDGFELTRYYLVQEGAASGDKLVTVAAGTQIGEHTVLTSGGNAYYEAYNDTYHVNTGATLDLNGKMGEASDIIVNATTLAINAIAPEGSTAPAIRVTNGGTLDVNAEYYGSATTLNGGNISVESVGYAGQVKDLSYTPAEVLQRDTITLESTQKDASGALVLSENSISGGNSAVYANIDGVGNLTVSTTQGWNPITLYGTVSHEGNLTLSGKVDLGANWAGGATISNTGDIIITSGSKVWAYKNTIIANTGSVQLQGGTLELSSDAAFSNLVLNAGVLNLGDHSLGSKENRGAILLGGSDEENAAALEIGTLSENTIQGTNTGLYSTISGVGNLTLEQSGNLTFNLHNTVQHTGDLTLRGNGMEIGNNWGGKASIENTGDVMISADVQVHKQSTIANIGDIRVKDGSLLVRDGSLLNEGNIVIDTEALLTVESGSSVANAGTVQVQDGTLLVMKGASFSTQGVEVSGNGVAQLEAASLAETVTAGTTTIAKLAEASVDYSQVQVTADALSSMQEGAALSNAHITVAAGGSYAINNVELSNTKLTVSGALTMDASSLEGAMLAEGVELNVEATGSIATLNGQVGVFTGQHSITLGDLADAGQEGAYTMLSSNQLDGLVLTGDASFSINLGALMDTLEEDAYLGLVFSGLNTIGVMPLADDDTLLTDSLGKYFVLEGAEGYTIANVSSEGDKTVLYIQGPAVPEPTTATLSLLGLAALAARRRRK